MKNTIEKMIAEALERKLNNLRETFDFPIEEALGSDEEIQAGDFANNCQNAGGKVSFIDGRMACSDEEGEEISLDQTGESPEVNLSENFEESELSYEVQRIIIQELEKVLYAKNK